LETPGLHNQKLKDVGCRQTNVQLNVAGQNQRKHKTTFSQTTQNDDTEEMPLQIPICQCLKQRAQDIRA
jgi:hypothetical protein